MKISKKDELLERDCLFVFEKFVIIKLHSTSPLKIGDRVAKNVEKR